MKKILKISIFIISILTISIISFYFGYVTKEASERKTKTLISKHENVKKKTCRSEYGNAKRAWDCKSHPGSRQEKLCALSLTVVDQNSKKGLVYIDDLELNANYEIEGLTQVWSFEDKSVYKLEPDGTAKYIKAIHLDPNLNELFSSDYVCEKTK